VALSAGARAQGQGTDYSKIDITAEKVAPNLYMLSGSAGLDPAIKTLPVAGSACWPARTASSWLMPIRTAHGQGRGCDQTNQPPPIRLWPIPTYMSTTQAQRELR